jgi:hypothetical protein
MHPLRQFRNDIRDEDAREYEAEALRDGTAGLGFEYHCYRCHSRHFYWSPMGQRHEEHGNPAIIRAAKKNGLLFLTREMLP